MAARLIAMPLACAAALAQQAPSDQTVFQKVCGSCHSTALISDLKSGPEWEETVDSMIERGAKATEAERAAILRYISRTYTRININTASADEIAEVLDLAPAAAEKIIAHRPYKSLEELMRADAAPNSKLQALKEHIAFR